MFTVPVSNTLSLNSDTLWYYHLVLKTISLMRRLLINQVWSWRYEAGLSPPVKCFYWPFQVRYFFEDHLHYMCLVFFIPSRLFIAAPCGHLLEKGWPLGFCLWCLMLILSLSNVVSWVRCGTGLYWFLIFDVFLIIKKVNVELIFTDKSWAMLFGANIVHKRCFSML